MSSVYRECNFYNVIEFSSSVRIYDRVEEFSDIKKFDSLDDIFEKYIDVEFVKDWFNEDDIKLEDVYEERDGIGVMSVNEDMSLYIFKNDINLIDLFENYVFRLDDIRNENFIKNLENRVNLKLQYIVFNNCKGE